MTDPVEFLKRRLDEEQAVIESSSSGKVGASPHAQMFYHHGPNYWTKVGADAAAALQLIAAHRRILELHASEQDWPVGVSDGDADGCVLAAADPAR